VLERGASALGGKDAWAKIKSVEMKAQLELPGQNIKGPIQTYMASPAKMVTVINFAGIGEIRTGYDGTVGWSIEPMAGPRLLEGGELDMIAREADMMKDADPMRRWDSVETVGDGMFAGFDCWKLEAVKGGSRSTLWYEKATGLQRGVETSIDSQMGKIPMSTALVEYREFEGPFGKIKSPARTETTQMGQKMVMTVESMTFDAVDPKVFELPAPIKALLEPEPSEEGDAPAADPAKPAAPAAPSQPDSPKKES
jgi:hypothetical protein